MRSNESCGSRLTKSAVAPCWVESLSRRRGRSGLSRQRPARPGGWRIRLHQPGEEGEIVDGVHAIDLIADRRLRIDRRIDLARGGV